MPSPPASRDRRPVRLRALAALLALVGGVAVVACTAPSASSSGASAAASTTSTVADQGSGPTSITKTIRTTEIASGFSDPTSMVNRPMRNQLWIAERAGYLRVIQLGADWNMEFGQTTRSGSTVQPFPVLDISADLSTEGSRGLLGVAFSTDARTLFLDYVNRKGEIVVAQWTVSDPAVPPPTTVPAETTSTTPGVTAPGATTTTRAPTTSTSIGRTPIPPPTVDPASKRVLLTIPHDGNSNYGGQLALGRDGFLYIGVGDSTKGSADRSAQNPDSLLGKLLRIDPGAANYTELFGIPPSNPYAKSGGAAPVFTLGVQNPLHFSFDRSNGDLWLGDAGSGRTQEIDLLTAASGGGRGANLGWPYLEGTTSIAGDAPSKLVAPLVAFDSSGDGCPVIGGYVYRGSAITDLQGVYLYGDHCSGSISGILQRRGRVLDRKPLGPIPEKSLASFGQDDQGELYALLSNGTLLKLVA